MRLCLPRCADLVQAKPFVRVHTIGYFCVNGFYNHWLWLVTDHSISIGLISRVTKYTVHIHIVLCCPNIADNLFLCMLLVSVHSSFYVTTTHVPSGFKQLCANMCQVVLTLGQIKLTLGN